MSTREMQLLSRIVRTGELARVVEEFGIELDDFQTPEGRTLFAYLYSYWRAPATKNAVLGLQAIQQANPSFQPCDDPSMTLDALAIEVKRARTYADIQTTAQAIDELARTDPFAAAEWARQQYTGIAERTHTKQAELSFSTAITSIVAKYQMRKAGYSFASAHWPWAPMDQATDGIQSDDYIVFYGRPKSKKSWILAYIIAFQYLQGVPVMLYTKEMTAENLYTRVAACIAGVPYTPFRQGRLEASQEQQIEQLAYMAQAIRGQQDIIALDAKEYRGRDTTAWLASKAKQHHPRLIAIDGLYLMSSTLKSKASREERISSISREVRDLTLDLQIPIIATFQATRGAAQHARGELDELAYSDAIGQDATLIIRTINKDDRVLLVPAGSREFNLNGIAINGKPATDFTFIEELTTADIEKAKKNDRSDEGGHQRKTLTAQQATQLTKERFQELMQTKPINGPS